MKIHEIKLYQEFEAPVEQVWEAFSDHARFGKMMGQQMVRIVDSTDAGNVNGTGSVRLIKSPLAAFEETIVKSEKPHSIEYRISKGLPVNYHYGHMQFKSLPGGKSAIDYTVKLSLKIPLIGGVLAGALKNALAGGLKNYAKRLAQGK